MRRHARPPRDDRRQPHRGKKPIRDFRRLRFYEREKEAGESAVRGDTEYAAVWLAAINQRQQR